MNQDSKISQLSAASTLDGTELAPVVQNGVTKKATIAQIVALASGSNVTDTAANFTANNPILLLGQLGIETDDLLTVPKFKIGDGSNGWNTLPYFGQTISNKQNQTFTLVDGSSPSTLSFTPISNSLFLYNGSGQYLQESVDYTLSADTITWIYTFESTNIYARYES